MSIPRFQPIAEPSEPDRFQGAGPLL